ncbi:MAG: hypothetical protein K2J95_12150 [Lachnospiraceae bacterium]|nr:hypothetical protein [Lachnospiraceae bacterium]
MTEYLAEVILILEEELAKQKAENAKQETEIAKQKAENVKQAAELAE